MLLPLLKRTDLESVAANLAPQAPAAPQGPAARPGRRGTANLTAEDGTRYPSPSGSRPSGTGMSQPVSEETSKSAEATGRRRPRAPRSAPGCATSARRAACRCARSPTTARSACATSRRSNRTASTCLPAPVFARGFLREYARVVGLNPDEVVNLYLVAIEERAEGSRRVERPKPARPESPRSAPSSLGYGLLLGLAVVLFVGIAALLSFLAERRRAAPRRFQARGAGDDGRARRCGAGLRGARPCRWPRRRPAPGPRPTSGQLQPADGRVAGGAGCAAGRAPSLRAGGRSGSGRRSRRRDGGGPLPRRAQLQPGLLDGVGRRRQPPHQRAQGRRRDGPARSASSSSSSRSATPAR